EMIRDQEYRVHGRALHQDEPAVPMTANRTSIQSITVWEVWARSVDSLMIIDEVLWCADQIRSLRPRFEPTQDFSRYSEEDLEFHHDRHFQKLLEQSGA